jgi:hypothetical protein
LTPAERVVLRALLDEYLHPERRDLDPCFYGPYGRVGRRVGLPASRVGQIELDTVGWAFEPVYARLPYLQIEALCDALHTPLPTDVLERSI